MRVVFATSLIGVSVGFCKFLGVESFALVSALCMSSCGLHVVHVSSVQGLYFRYWSNLDLDCG